MKRAITEQDFIEALNRTAATLDGQIVLACLKEFVNFDGDILAGDNIQATYANATLRRAYLYLRNRIDLEHLKKIEFNYVRKAQTNVRPDRPTKPSDRPDAKRTKPTKRKR